VRWPILLRSICREADNGAGAEGPLEAGGEGNELCSTAGGVLLGKR
jgi:hypothetical protein